VHLQKGNHLKLNGRFSRAAQTTNLESVGYITNHNTILTMAAWLLQQAVPFSRANPTPELLKP